MGGGSAFGHERGRRDLRDHESGIDAAFFDEKCGKAAHLRVDEDRDPALGQRADLADRVGEHIGREGDRLGVEVATGERLGGLREHEWIVGDGVGFDHEGVGSEAHDVEDGSHDLWLATQGVRVLDSLAVFVKLLKLTFAEKTPCGSSDFDLTPVASRPMDSRVERDSAREQGVDAEHSCAQRRRKGTLGAKECLQGQSGRDLGSVQEREALLRAQFDRRASDATPSLG